jgi:uncharacterized protein
MQAAAAPYRPQDDAQILERLPGAGDAGTRALRQLHAQLARSPDDMQLALKVARRDIEIGRGEADPEYRLKLQESKVRLPAPARKKGPRYTPVSRRHERPSAILWLVRNHPELKDAQIMRLVGTTKTTIASIRDRTHWNASQLTPMDPVTLGLCSQIDLDFEVSRAAKEKPVVEASSGATLLPASETTRKEEAVPEPVGSFSEKSREQADDAAVFAKLKQLGGGKKDEEE